jgi:predicted amidohydrolase YtcJ
MLRVLLALLLSFALSPSLLAQKPADLVLYNGKVATVDSAFSVQSAVVVRGNRIIAVGGDELADQYRAPREIDLRGRMVLPGFHDAHMHLWAPTKSDVDLSGVTSMADLKQRIREKAEELGPGEWITATAARGWSEDMLGGRRPLRADLDEAAPDNPVFIDRVGGHSRAVNSLALKLAGITRETPNPPNGIIERDSAGEPNGILREGPAAKLVLQVMPRPTEAERWETRVPYLRDLLKLGITSITEASWHPLGWKDWQRAYREHGESLPRATVQFRALLPDDGTAAPAVEALREFGHVSGEGDHRLRIGALKVYVDGGFSGASAATLEPYANDSTWYGTIRVPEAELYKLVKAAHAMGWQMGFHTVGDAAIKQAVDVFARVLEESPRKDHRHYVNHFTVMPPEETMRRMAEHNILIVQQPNFVHTNEEIYREYLTGERLERNTPLRTPMRNGIRMALSSDDIPLGPLFGIYAAVTRKGESGRTYGADEALTVREAIRGYTQLPAYTTFEEDFKGSIEPGKLADLVVLSENLLTIDPDSIPEVQVDMTVLGGKVVFEWEAGPNHSTEPKSRPER